MKKLRLRLQSSSWVKSKVMVLVHIFVAITVCAMLIAGWFLVKDSEAKELQYLHETLGAMARNFAHETGKLGHSNINIKTNADDPTYLQIIETMKEWMRLNPQVVSIYTMRKGIDGNNYFVAAPETDYNRDGFISGDLEQRVPIWEQYPEKITELEQAFNNIESIQKAPNRDKWGFSISAFAPIYDPSGKLEAVFGVDYDGTDWNKAVLIIGQKIVLFLMLPILILYLIYLVIFHFYVKEIKNIYHIVHHDTLTGLPNRLLFHSRLGQTIGNARGNKKLLAVMFIDLDNFKQINDTFGHTEGDILLQLVAQRLLTCIKPLDTIARWGGDEFTLLLSNVEEMKTISETAESIKNLFNHAFQISGREFYITSSIGISVYPINGSDEETIIKNADTAMYKAKRQGSNNYCFYDSEMNKKSFERLRMETSLHRALELGELSIDYQLQVDCITGNLTGAEALLRWNNTNMGKISPAEFIPIAEQTGLILPIGEWVLRNACQQNKLWQIAGYPTIKVAVNASALQFSQKNFAETVQKVLEETGLDPQFLELEITESIAMDNTDYVINNMRKLKQLGVNIAIDDFGTGYSSFSRLQNLPIDKLKIDRSFVNQIASDMNNTAIIRAIISMAHSIGLKVVAEGVESINHLKCLQNNQCDEVQGYYIAKPVPPDTFAELLIDWETRYSQVM